MKKTSFVYCCIIGACLLAYMGDLALAEEEQIVVSGECEEVQVVAEEANAQHMAEKLEARACEAVLEFGKLFGVELGKVRIRILGSMDRWRQETGRAWYIVAALRENEILTQPVSSLNRLDDPSKAVVHEIAHIFIRKLAGRGCPRWLDEGLAQWLSGDRKRHGNLPSKSEVLLLEKRLQSSDKNRVTREKDYEQSLGLVQRLVDSMGPEVLVSYLRKIARAKDPLNVSVGGNRLEDLLIRRVDASEQK